MKIGITPLIEQNFAPTNAKSLSIYKGDTKICDVDISKMKLQNLGTKLYSFGLLSDLHCAGNNSIEGTRLDNALTYFEQQGCTFCCHSGDMTNIGFWNNSTDSEIYLPQMAEYKSVCDAHPNLPMYGICGNHESYNKAITNNLTELKTYTGITMNYTMTQGNDVFIFLSQPSGSIPMTDEALAWLETTLEANKNKRCFVFVHPYVDNSDSGNPYGVYGNNVFEAWGTTKKNTFIELLNRYKNTLLFHGHSHMHFDMQREVKNAIYSTTLGFKSLHVPSISWNRMIVDNASVNVGGCYGYLVEVYENHVVFKGYDFLNNDFVPIAQYCIQF